MTIVGRTYLERGAPVEIVAQWRNALPHEPPTVVDVETALAIITRPAGTVRLFGPRNVLICRADGTLVVRPFRGLRKARS